ncbi:hypothetical protein VIGAN_01424400 [Vigna angularis var. angularis]|uniref:N-acetyltransferase domain-containing protein n=2 Tax=Phaseolus angularis TaxID=3914 RepID=A0A0S3R6Y7_PHAAN|nr:hypothetical protein VIGAN_01424400 [Vigna angularis var. angularis]
MAASLKWKNKSGFITFGKRVDTIQEEYDWNKKWWREPRPGHFHACIIAVKKHSKDVTRTVRGSVKGTLDLDITCLDHPGVKRRPSGFYINKISSTGYIGSISNVCVAYSYRHKGIVSNMLCFAIEYSKSRGVKNLYVEVQENNGPALALFQKLGFKVLIEIENPRFEILRGNRQLSLVLQM